MDENKVSRKLVEIKDTTSGKLAIFDDGVEAQIQKRSDGSMAVTIDGKEFTPLTPKGIRYTPDGEKIVFDNNTEAFLPEVIIKEMPAKFKERHKDAMFHIYSFLSEMKLRAPKRQIPMTRGELIEWGVSKRDIAALDELGFIQERIISMLEQRTQKPVGGRSCVYFTPLGKAFLKQSGVLDG